MRVLDAGCGSGAITRGIAEAVAPGGHVVGLDANASLIEEARRLHADVPGLAFEVGDIYRLPYQGALDIVTAARVLQWLADPGAALRSMITAARPGGWIVALDYNHEKLAWQPDPPESMRAFYAAFLRWRADAGMDNAIADHLAAHFTDLGLRSIQVTSQPETTRRGDADFTTRIGIWAGVAQGRGKQMVQDGYLTEAQRLAAETDYRRWIETEAQSQTLYLLAVEGVR
jgi:SAM-dependent methyltransferase